MKNKIGILGGNFNPVHNAHLMMADQVAQRLQLERVYLMPEAQPPHIDTKTTIDSTHRLAMLNLAVADNPKLAVLPLEIERGGKSYTYDSMKILTAQQPDTDFYFIIGSDMVDYLPKWYKIDELLQLVHFVAIKRSAQVKATPYPVTWLDAPLMPISSTLIRDMIATNLQPNYLLPPAVLDYIKSHKLYSKK